MDGPAFLSFFEAQNKMIAMHYKKLAREQGLIEEYEAHPLVTILTNRPHCCYDIANAYVEHQQAAHSEPEYLINDQVKEYGQLQPEVAYDLSGLAQTMGLGLASLGDQSLVKGAYHRPCLLHHPDKGGDESRFRDAQEAYNDIMKVAKERRLTS